jgi:hypothetical protein
VTYLNSLLRGIVDILLSPFRSLHWLVGLALVSLVTGIVMLLIFKATSNQTGIAAVKRRIHAGLFEIRLFNDDLLAILRAQTEILRHNLTYLRLSLVPMLWMIVPLVLVIAQLQFHYGYQGLDPGQSALVKVQLREGWEKTPGVEVEDATDKPPISLIVPPGLQVETPAVWVPSSREAAWRIMADEWGDYDVQVKLGEQTVSKSARVSRQVGRRSPFRLAPGFLNQLLYPAEDPLPQNSAVTSIELTYPEKLLFGVPLWMVVFFVLSIIFAFALRNRFGVNI